MFRMSPASLQTFTDTSNCVLEDRIPYSTVHIPNVFCDGHLQIINCVGIIFGCFLYCNYQVHRDFLIILYKFEGPATLVSGPGEEGKILSIFCNNGEISLYSLESDSLPISIHRLLPPPDTRHAASGRPECGYRFSVKQEKNPLFTSVFSD
jgi:hypothetical protein